MPWFEKKIAFFGPQTTLKKHQNKYYYRRDEKKLQNKFFDMKKKNLSGIFYENRCLILHIDSVHKGLKKFKCESCDHRATTKQGK